MQLGTQVVSGVNYAFICRSKSVALNPLTAYCLVICYADTENQCSITKIKEIVKDSECPIGGLHCTKISEAFIAKIDSIEADYIVKAFNQAFQNIKGVTYFPELLIAKQVATGLNCHFIAKAKIADEEGTTNFKHVVINIFMNESKILKIEHL
ncbi:hypothetical protein [Helicobacter sp. MIT 05-5294]|uniref:hypothetical protein n=1 Tax=Helicobacter sp. MIT 05-5294 TaxID=1548150 RepID=UPI0010FF5002|nr:hypothetical protein [Helicobacter sp. MIT 05-5294]TLD85492.1 hypothetical protein LS69_009335 [Helicobacter sp. MIT 05-5294]